MRIRYFLLVAATVLSACGAPDSGLVLTGEEKLPPPLVPSKPEYSMVFSEEMIGQGKPLVVFFHGSDTFSVKSDQFLTALYGTGGTKISTYKVEFNAMTGARIRHSVFLPDTFLLFSGSGVKVQSIVHPTQTELRTLLTTPH